MRNGAARPRAAAARGRAAHRQETTEATTEDTTEDSTDIVTTVRERVSTLRETLIRQTKQHPGRSAAIALGAGFLLGGGLFSRFTARVVGAGVRLGLRMAVVPFITQSLVAAVDGLRHSDHQETRP
jgi:hypothetical protein